jgi:hypothetical protein
MKPDRTSIVGLTGVTLTRAGIKTLLFPDPRPFVERLGQDFFRQLTKRHAVYLMEERGWAIDQPFGP